MRLKTLAAAGLVVLSLAACKDEEACTPELAQTKMTEMVTKVQELATKDPAKLQEIGPKAAELQSKFANLGDKPEEACKAIDELLALMN